MEKRAFPRPPDWLIYLAAASLILWVVLGQREDADAPAPSMGAAGSQPIPIVSPIASGAAFSVSQHGLWVTAGHVVRDCQRIILLVAEGRGVVATATFAPDADLALLSTEGGAPALPLFEGRLRSGARGFHPGFPRGRPGELTSRFIGRDTLPADRRSQPRRSVLAWAETGRTEGAEGALYGLSGAPVLDNLGQVVGVTVGESPRRGRIYTTDPDSVLHLVTSAGVAPAPLRKHQLISVGNYGQVAEDLRRSLSVAQVVCFKT